MNTALVDCGGTGSSSVADISHKLVSPINPDSWVYNTDELIRYPQRRKQPSMVWAHFKLYKCHEKRGYEGLLTKLSLVQPLPQALCRTTYVEKLRMSLMLGFQFPKHDK